MNEGARPQMGDSPPDEILDVAACKGMDPESFHPERGASTAEARAVCVTCPALHACAEWAITTNQNYGIWGNTSVRERREIRRERARARQVAA